MNNLVSIIVPAYNAENFIDQCLDSILAQTYKDFEVIVIDDGSKDDTWNHIKSFMDKDSRIKGFRRENVGVSASRNFALEQAAGQYIQFVDSDDYLPENDLQVLVEALEKSDSDWVNCQYFRVDDDGNRLEDFDFSHGTFNTDTQELRFNFIRDELIEYHIGYEVWNKLFKTSIIRDNSIRFTQDCHIGEDLAFNICYGFFAKKINCISDRLYFYRIREGSAMGTTVDKIYNFKEHIALIKGIEGSFNNAFSGQLKDKFYQLFYKLILHSFQGLTAAESLEIVKSVPDEFFSRWFEEALSHKAEFEEIFPAHKFKMCYRYGCYIQYHLKANLLGMISLGIVDLYRVIRGRTTVKEWRLL